MKYRKPRFSKKRIEAAEAFLNVADVFIKDGLLLDLNGHLIPEEAQGVVARNTSYTKNRKVLLIGREFLTDLVLWQRSQLEKEK